jgi:hypothetical protein
LVSWLLKIFWRAGKSGAEATAVQTLRECPAAANRAKRLDCGAFTAAFGWTENVRRNEFAIYDIRCGVKFAGRAEIVYRISYIVYRIS